MVIVLLERFTWKECKFKFKVASNPSHKLTTSDCQRTAWVIMYISTFCCVLWLHGYCHKRCGSRRQIPHHSIYHAKISTTPFTWNFWKYPLLSMYFSNPFKDWIVLRVRFRSQHWYKWRYCLRCLVGSPFLKRPATRDNLAGGERSHKTANPNKDLNLFHSTFLLNNIL